MSNPECVDGEAGREAATTDGCGFHPLLALETPLLRRPRTLQAYDRVALKLLKFGPFERRARGGWRFGTKTISTAIVDRLIASGHAEDIEGRITLKRAPRAWRPER